MRSCLSAQNSNGFGERFKTKGKQKELEHTGVQATLFNLDPADSPDNLQHKIIELQSNEEVKAALNRLPFLQFYDMYDMRIFAF